MRKRFKRRYKFGKGKRYKHYGVSRGGIRL